MSNSWRLRSPDWGALTALLDDLCWEKSLVTKGGTPNYQQLARACSLTPATLYGIRHRSQRPSRLTLEKIAQYAGQPLGPWLAAAGLDPTDGGSVD